jgi:hypothetical protein
MNVISIVKYRAGKTGFRIPHQKTLRSARAKQGATAVPHAFCAEKAVFIGFYDNRAVFDRACNVTVSVSLQGHALSICLEV